MRHIILIGAALCALPFYAGADTMRPAVGKPLLQAEALMKQGDYHAALLKANQAGAVAALTPYETLVVAQVRGAAAAGAGDYAVAASSYQTVLASGTQPLAAQLQLTQAIAGFYYEEPNYPQAITWVNKYTAAGGNNEQTRALLAQAYYNQGSYAQAEHAVQQGQSSGQTLSEGQLQLLASSAQKAGDSAGYQDALQALLADYPRTAYWNEAISNLTSSPNFPDSLTLNVYRLRFATGTLTAASDYEDYAERAILANQPAEAKHVIYAGFSNGILTSDTDEGHAARLQTLAAKDSAEDAQALPARLQQLKASGDVQSLIDTGVDLALQGQPAQGADLIRAATNQSASDNPLDLGVAYFAAGDNQAAIQNFKTAQLSGDHFEAALARLWQIRVENATQTK